IAELLEAGDSLLQSLVLGDPLHRVVLAVGKAKDVRFLAEGLHEAAVGLLPAVPLGLQGHFGIEWMRPEPTDQRDGPLVPFGLGNRRCFARHRRQLDKLRLHRVGGADKQQQGEARAHAVFLYFFISCRVRWTMSTYCRANSPIRSNLRSATSLGSTS